MAKTKIDLAEVARTLGMHYRTADELKLEPQKRNEVVDAYDAPGGTVVTTFDGQTYIIVPEDKPDAEGKTGVMWLSAPPRIVDGHVEPYAGTFPVFANPGSTVVADDEQADG